MLIYSESSVNVNANARRRYETVDGLTASIKRRRSNDGEIRRLTVATFRTAEYYCGCSDDADADADADGEVRDR